MRRVVMRGMDARKEEECDIRQDLDEYEGRLIAWPFKSSRLQEVERSMMELGILCHEDARRGSWSRLSTGFEVRVEGPGVRGYFVDSEGLESPRSDLDVLIMKHVNLETDFHIRGLHQVDDERMVAVSLTARHDGISVVWSGSRALIARDAKPDVHADGISVPGF